MGNPISAVAGAIFKSGAASTGFDPVTSVANLIHGVLDRVLPDKTANDAAKMQLAEMQLNGELSAVAGQIQTNIAEAASTHAFVSGWRPYIGWICGTGLAYQMLLRPLLTFAVGVCGGHTVAPPIEIQDLLTILASLLGLGAMRTVEKVNGVPGAQDSVK